MTRKPRSKTEQESNIIDRFLRKENPAVKDAIDAMGVEFDSAVGRFIRKTGGRH